LIHYRYNRYEEMDARYRRGRVDALAWLCELLGYYLEEERRIDRRLHGNVEAQLRKIRWLPPSPYRRGIEESIREFYALFDEGGG
jgi:hypothetical protein